MVNLVEYIREQAILRLFSTNTVENCWPKWKREINKHISTRGVSEGLIDLGDHLSKIFKVTAIEGRGQQSVSTGGTAWEALVCWYLNACLVGSRVVVIKQAKQLVPEPIRCAIQVNYGSVASNTESDLIAIEFPNNSIFTKDISELNLTDDSGSPIPNQIKGKFNYKKIIDHLVGKYIDQIKVVVVQCKTNWNDNAQIPMLWDMVYSSKGFKNRNIHIGCAGYELENLKEFSYAFMTVPTVSKPVTSSSTAAQRVRGLSGGNFWGQPSVDGVAQSIKEIFTRNFSTGFDGNIRAHLHNSKTLLEQSTYFRLF